MNDIFENLASYFKDHDQRLSDHNETGLNFYERYRNTDIDRTDDGLYVAFVFDSVQNKNVDVVYNELDDVKADLDRIHANNYYNALQEIAAHFNHTEDFNNGFQNLENLIQSINKRVDSAKELMCSQEIDYNRHKM